MNGMVTPFASALEIEKANTWHQRFLGLMFRRNLRHGHGMLLSPCNSVHTGFMRFDIDVVFLNTEFKVLVVRARLKPWRLSWGPSGSRHALELPAGSASAMGIHEGQDMRKALTDQAC